MRKEAGSGLRARGYFRHAALLPGFPQDPHLLRAIEVSVEALAAEKFPGLGERYLDFAVFPEDAAISAAVLRTFWQPPGLRPTETDEAVDRLWQLSLVRHGENGFPARCPK